MGLRAGGGTSSEQMNSSHRRIRALERGVEWLPRHDSHYILAGMMVSARAAPPICILQHTFRDLDEHLRSAQDFAFGLLAGSLCTCKQSGRHYTLVDGFVPCQLPAGTGGDDPYGLIALALRQQIVMLERTGKLALGFYLCDTTVVPHVALEDVGLFRSVFTQPWNLMLIRDQGDDGDLGAFIRVEPVDERAFAAPFTELISERAGRRSRGEVPPSVVRWVNYQPTEPVTAATDRDMLPPAGARGSQLDRWPAGQLIHKLGLDRASQALSPWVASAAAKLRKIDGELSDVVMQTAKPDRALTDAPSAEFALPPVVPRTPTVPSIPVARATPSASTTSEPPPVESTGPAAAPGNAASARSADTPGIQPEPETSVETGVPPVTPPVEASAPAAEMWTEAGASAGVQDEQQRTAGDDSVPPVETGVEPSPAPAAREAAEMTEADDGPPAQGSGPASVGNGVVGAAPVRENRSQLFEVLMMPPDELEGVSVSSWRRYLGIGAVMLAGLIVLAAILVMRM